MRTLIHSASLSAAVDSVFDVESLEGRRMFSAGALDPSFGAAGHVLHTSLPAAAAVAVQADGKVVEVGSILGNFELARFNPDGTFDNSFGYMGRLVTDFGGTDMPTNISIQSDGKILAGGWSGTKFVAARYLNNGQLDATFGTGGIATADFGASLPVGSANLLLRSDGKIVMIGTGGPTGFGAGPGSTKFLFARFNANGSLDSSFGSGGQLTSAAPDGSLFNSAALTSDQKIVAVGAYYLQYAYALVRQFNADGSVGATAIHGDGQGLEYLHKVAIQADGKLLISGESDSAIFFRDNADGSLDTTFSATPVVADGILPQSDGKIIVDSAGTSPGNNTVERLNTDGSLDTTWGTAGKTTLSNANLLANAPGGESVAAGGNNFLGQELDLYRLTGDTTSTVAPPSGSPFNGTPSAIPGQIEAEDFDNTPNYHSSNPTNYTGNLYRTSGVTVEHDSDTDAGYDVGYLHAGDYMSYTVNVAATANYDFSARVSNAAAGGAFHVNVDGVNVTGSIAIPNTGAYQVYQNVTKTSLALTAGSHTITLVMDSNNAFGYAGNFNWIKFTPSGTTPPVTTTGTGSISGTVFNDTPNQDGVQGVGEVGIAGQQIYLDLSGVGHYLRGDPTTTTDSNGNYLFSGLPLTNYLVRVEPDESQFIDSPTYGGDRFVQLGVNPVARSQNFGIVSVASRFGVYTYDAGDFLVGSISYPPGSPVADLGVRAYNSHDVVDTTFGSAGYVHLASSQAGSVKTISVLPNGNIVAAINFAGASELYLISPSGVVLKSVATTPDQVVYQTAVQSDNKIVVSMGTFNRPDRSIRRYNTDLTIDNSFGGAGTVPIFSASGYTPTKLVILGDGGIQATYNNGTDMVVNLGANGLPPIQ